MVKYHSNRSDNLRKEHVDYKRKKNIVLKSNKILFEGNHAKNKRESK